MGKLIFVFGRHHYQSPVIRLYKKLLQDFKLLQALALHAAITRFYALALGEFLNRPCGSRLTLEWSMLPSD